MSSITKPVTSRLVVPRATRVLHVLGSDVATGANGTTAAIGTNDTGKMLRLVGPAIQVSSMVISPSFLRQGRGWERHKFDLVWNAISDPDLNPKTLAVFKSAFEGQGTLVVNQADHVFRTTRHNVSLTLQGVDGVVMPKTLLIRLPTDHRIRAIVEDTGFRFPAILRRVGTQNGDVLGVFPSIDSMSTIFGDRKGQYYLTEFIDVRRGDGLFRKTRCFFVGDKIIARHHVITNKWKITGSNSTDIMPSRNDLLKESQDIIYNGFDGFPERIQNSLRLIRNKIGLDYFGIDFCMMENNDIVVFECNATMNFNPNFDEISTRHNQIAVPRLMSALNAFVGKAGARRV